MTYDDDYEDEYEEEGYGTQPYSNDSDAYVRSTAGYVGDAETMLRRAIDIIATAPTMPLSSSPRIDRDQFI